MLDGHVIPGICTFKCNLYVHNVVSCVFNMTIKIMYSLLVGTLKRVQLPL